MGSYGLKPLTDRGFRMKVLGAATVAAALLSLAAGAWTPDWKTQQKGGGYDGKKWVGEGGSHFKERLPYYCSMYTGIGKRCWRPRTKHEGGGVCWTVARRTNYVWELQECDIDWACHSKVEKCQTTARNLTPTDDDKFDCGPGQDCVE